MSDTSCQVRHHKFKCWLFGVHFMGHGNLWNIVISIMNFISLWVESFFFFVFCKFIANDWVEMWDMINEFLCCLIYEFMKTKVTNLTEWHKKSLYNMRNLFKLTSLCNILLMIIIIFDLFFVLIFFRKNFTF